MTFKVQQRELLAVPAACTISRRNSTLLSTLTMLNELLASALDCDLVAWRSLYPVLCVCVSFMCAIKNICFILFGR